MKKGNIFIYGLIGKEFQNPDGSIEKGIDLLNVISQYQAQKDSDEFDVHINSKGGYVTDGFDIYNFLRSIGKPIHTIAKGDCMSMATVIFMSGDTRTVDAGTKFMIHLPWGRTEGNAEEMEIYAKSLKQVESKVLDFYSKNTGLSKEALTPLLKNETFLTPDQTIELGFASHKWTTVDAVAKLNTNEMNWIDKMLGKSVDEPKMLETTLADGNMITVETEAESPAVGDKVFDQDGNALPDGEHVDSDGNVLVVADGAIKEIKEATEEEPADEEMQAKLQKLMESFNERIAKIEARHKDEGKKESSKISALETKLEKMSENFLSLQKTVKSKPFTAIKAQERKGIQEEGEDSFDAKIAKQREARKEKEKK